MCRNVSHAEAVAISQGVYIIPGMSHEQVVQGLVKCGFYEVDLEWMIKYIKNWREQAAFSIESKAIQYSKLDDALKE